MKAFNFFRIDCIRCKMQLLMALGLMAFFSIFFSFHDMSVGFISGYLFFISITFAGQPFNIETQSESGFLDMLPGTRRQKVNGRFLYAIAGVVMAALLGTIVIIINEARGLELPDYIWQAEVGLIGVALFMIGIEYICLYAAGKGRSQQFITLIQLIPSFTMFFGVAGAAEYLSSRGIIDPQRIMEYKTEVAAAVLVFGILFFGIAYLVANRILERRDYA